MRRFLLAAALFACAHARPADTAATLRAAQQDLAAGKPVDAQHEFEEVLADDPGELAAIRGRVEAGKRAGSLGRILREAQARVDARSDDVLAQYTLGLAAFASGDEALAVRSLRAAAALRPGEADIQYRLGVALLDGEHFADARAPLEAAVRLAPKVARYRPPLAVCLARLGDRKAAMATLAEVPRLSPAPDEAAAAVKAARALTDLFTGLPPDTRAPLEQALGYLVRDAPGLARPILEDLLGRMTDLAPAHALLGLAVARVDEVGRAVTELRRAAELAPELPQPHAWLAELYASRDKTDLAAQELRAALDRNPLDAELLKKLGTLQLAQGDGGALDTLARAALVAPDDDALQLLLARAELGGGQRDAARARLSRLSEKRPDDPEVLLRLAVLLYEDRARAAEDARGSLTRRCRALLERVLVLQPGNAAASRLLAQL